MPSATQQPSTMAPGKKRRREDVAQAPPSYSEPRAFSNSPSPSLEAIVNSNSRLNPICHTHIGRGQPHNFGIPESLFGVPRKIIPLPVTKRLRRADDGDHDYESRDYILPRSNGHHHHQQQQYHSGSPSPQSRPQITRLNSSALLSPCHICHRKPTKKSDLDSFADCQGCGQRTCFVCIRECQGWLSADDATKRAGTQEDEEEQDMSASFTMLDADDDVGSDTNTGKQDMRRELSETKPGHDRGWLGGRHRDVVCSRCCIEKGNEGDVVCLGCLAGMEGA